MPEYQQGAPFRLSDRYAPLIEEALKKAGQGEEIAWETGLVPAQNNPTAPVLTVFLWMRAPVLGTVINGSIQFADPFNQATQEFVDEQMRTFIEALRKARSEMVAPVANGHREAPPTSPGPGGSGLVLPPGYRG